MDTTPVYIISNIKRFEVGHSYIANDNYNNPTMHLTHALQFTLCTTIIVVLGFCSYAMQRYPVRFIFYPKMDPHDWPDFLIKIWKSQIFTSGIFMLMIILADIILYHSTKSKRDQQLQYCDVSQRWRYISQVGFQQSYFLVKIYLYDIVDDLKSLHVIKLILDVAALALVLANFILGSVGIFRCAVYMTEVLTLRLRTSFQLNLPAFRFFNAIISVMIYTF